MKKILETLKQKWSEYLFETIVITIGVMVAFGLNSWNQGRINSETANDYLVNLAKDLEADTIRYESFYLQRFKGKLEALYLVKQYNNEEYQVQDTLSFLNKISYGAIIGSGINLSNNSVFSELTNTGNIRLIDDRLRKKIIDYYSTGQRYSARSKQNLSGYLPFINSSRPYNPDQPDFINKYDQKRMLQKCKSKEFSNIVNLEISNSFEINKSVFLLKQAACEVLKDIEKEIQD